MRRVVLCTALAVFVSGTTLASRPSGGSSPPSNPQIAYEILSGKSDKLMVSNEDGTNASTLYTSSQAFRFDLAPRSQHQIALIDSLPGAMIHLLTYGVTGSGTFATTSTVVLNTGAHPPRRGSNVDFSPDGTRLAYACDPNNIDREHVCVYDLPTGAIAVWGSDVFYWDLAWFRNGASIAYSSPNSDGTNGNTLYELPGAGAAPIPLHTDGGDIYLDASRTNPDALTVDYHDPAGNAFSGLFEAPTASNPTAHFIDPISPTTHSRSLAS